MSEVGLAQEIAERLALAGCVFAGEEAEEIVRSAPDAATARAWTVRREAGEPLAWIVGWVEFAGATYRIDLGVYVPRPQTEELARRAAELLPRHGRAVDLCTGSGVVAAHVGNAVDGVAVVGTDLDPRAVVCARRNGVSAVRADLGDGLRSGVFDVVTAVAPYVPTGEIRLLPADVQRFEAGLALDGGVDGLAVARRAVGAAARLLRRDGWLLVELGGAQDVALTGGLGAAGFVDAEPWFDADGDLRGVAARRDG